jgi:REP element-mobilizing transposase RayT
MKYDPLFYDRKSNRLYGYDYTSGGDYFITICAHNRECWFGEIAEGKMILNDIGETGKKYLTSIPEHFPGTEIGEYVIMPNHVHLILVLNDAGTCHGMSTQTQPNLNQFGKPVSGSVSVIINHYKSSVKRWCNKNHYKYFQWQSRFHDHIIRNEASGRYISEYIKSNPVK